MNKIVDQDWLEVPERVQSLYAKHAADAVALVRGPKTIPAGWILDTEVGPVFISKYAFDVMPILEKGRQALSAVPGVLSAGATGIQKALGGPNPLTASLLGGALGAGLGYGGGWLANKIAPNYIGPDAAWKWSLLGGVGGAGVPAFVHGYPNTKELGWRGIFAPSRYQGRQGGADTIMNLFPKDRPLTAAEQQEVDDAAKYDQDNLVEDTLKKACAAFGLEPVIDAFVEKAADVAGATLGEIPTDEWGRVVMYDPYLDHNTKAVAAGLPYAASSATGSNWVTPMDVARVAANTVLGKGIGYGMGVVAKTFLGFTPQAQQGLQQAGMLAGAVRGVMRMLS